MSAFNWVVIENVCPVCNRMATVRCQTHVASSFGGAADGRFQDRDYRLGERMRWWRVDDPDYPTWRVQGRKGAPLQDDAAEEACHSVCTLCGARLYVILRFEDLTPRAVLGLGPEEQWPADYGK